MRVQRDNRVAGFTLIEVLTVVVVIAILALILIATFLKARAQSAVAASKVNMKNIGITLETYYSERNEYPSSLDQLIPDYARVIPNDPCTGNSYAYDTSMGGSPPTDYRISIAYPLSNPCRLVVSGLSYTPGGGLVDSP